MKRIFSPVVFFLLAILLVSCNGKDYSWGWYVVSPWKANGRVNVLFLLSGLNATLIVSFLAFILSFFIGFINAFLGQIPNSITKIISSTWVLVFRSVPVLVMLLWLYYGLPIAFGIDLNVYSATIIGLALCQSAFQSEVFRTGILSIPKSQIEASQVFGANIFQIYYYIITPQVLRIVLPTLANQFIYMLKISSLASVIGLTELTRKANELTTLEYRPLEIYSFLVLEYLVLIISLTYLVKILEKRIENPHS